MWCCVGVVSVGARNGVVEGWQVMATQTRTHMAVFTFTIFTLHSFTTLAPSTSRALPTYTTSSYTEPLFSLPQSIP